MVLATSSKMDFQLAKLKHRQALNTIAQRLSQYDLEQLVFICEGVLPESTTEKIHSAISLFRELEHRTLIGPGEYNFLKGIFISIGRNDIASTLNKLIIPPPVRKSGLYVSSFDHRSLLMKISSQLRKDDVQNMAYLCFCNANEGLSLIETLEHRGLISNDNYDFLAERLSDIGRHDLCQLLPISTRGEVVMDKLSILVQRKLSLSDS